MENFFCEATWENYFLRSARRRDYERTTHENGLASWERTPTGRCR